MPHGSEQGQTCFENSFTVSGAKHPPPNTLGCCFQLAHKTSNVYLCVCLSEIIDSCCYTSWVDVLPATRGNATCLCSRVAAQWVYFACAGDSVSGLSFSIRRLVTGRGGGIIFPMTFSFITLRGARSLHAPRAGELLPSLVFTLR